MRNKIKKIFVKIILAHPLADQAAGALEGVPVIGELAGAARPFIKQGKGLIHMTQGGVHDAQKINNKFGKLKIK